jgi:hypothetical protein
MKRVWILVLVLFSGSGTASVAPATQLEIEHLLNFIRNSSCIIDRNGKTYAADKAISHIEKKYAYFEDDIETTEDFIELSASKSTMSGKYYMVRCGDGEQIRTREWLMQELKGLREQS